jgi:hypothetical protein
MLKQPLFNSIYELVTDCLYDMAYEYHDDDAPNVYVDFISQYRMVIEKKIEVLLSDRDIIY